MEYINEHILPGKLGHFLVLLGFISSLLAALSYWFATRNKEQIQGELPLEKDAARSGWLRMGRGAFVVHSLAVFGIVGTIFYMMLNQYYEYHYVMEHVSDDLDFRYIFSAFWEGQEGSFLLWMFWHAVLGLILLRTAKAWEAPVITTLSLIQAFIMSMILGLYFYHGDDFTRIGSSPFVMVRDMFDAPIFSRPDYVAALQGKGLNPLLQNYWMTIHPPTLFLGFASTAIPFCYAVAGLWTGEHKAWLKPALPWALFSGAILGTGILMGGAWAYEALSFGGYWAWDPVENMSLVPWIVLIAGIHTGVVAKNTGHSIKATYLFFILTFVLILYSTFLTRSGVLGDTSVHAFTEMGLEWQLVGFILAFLIPPLFLLFSKRNEIPSPKKEESAYSKEFWMFIGSLVLIFSSVLISFTTSIPVFNKILTFFSELGGGNPVNYSPPEDVVAHYNKYQLWIGVFVGMLSGMAQFLRYKDDKMTTERWRKFLTHTGFALAISIVGGWAMAYFSGIRTWQYILLLITGLYAITTNLDYVITVLRGKIQVSGSAVAHIGFGIMLLGVIFSGAKKEVISKGFMDTSAIEGFNAEDARINMILPKETPVVMNDYVVTYKGDEMDKFTRQFTINYKRYNEDKSEIIEEFDLHPNVLYNKMLTKIESSNPATKHYFAKDIFTYVSALPMSETDPEAAKAQEDSLQYVEYIVSEKDTMFTSEHYITFDGFSQSPTHEDYKAQPGDIPVAAQLTVHKMDTDSVWKAEPVYLIRNNFGLSIDDKIDELGLRFRFNKVDPAARTMTFEIAEGKPRTEYIVMQAILFPGINLVWLGSIMMMLGLAMGMVRRWS